MAAQSVILTLTAPSDFGIKIPLHFQADGKGKGRGWKASGVPKKIKHDFSLFCKVSCMFSEGLIQNLLKPMGIPPGLRLQPLLYCIHLYHQLQLYSCNISGQKGHEML